MWWIILAAAVALGAAYIAGIATHAYYANRPREGDTFLRDYDNIVTDTLKNRGAELADNAMRTNALMRRLYADSAPRPSWWGFRVPAVIARLRAARKEKEPPEPLPGIDRSSNPFWKNRFVEPLNRNGLGADHDLPPKWGGGSSEGGAR